jgi:hypothetical protein
MGKKWTTLSLSQKVEKQLDLISGWYLHQPMIHSNEIPRNNSLANSQLENPRLNTNEREDNG